MERKGWESMGFPDVKHYGNESTGRCADWGTFDLEFSRSSCISGMGDPIVMERKGRELIGCHDVKHNRCDLETKGNVRDRGDIPSQRFRCLI